MESFGESHEGRAAICYEPLVRQISDNGRGEWGLYRIERMPEKKAFERAVALLCIQ